MPSVLATDYENFRVLVADNASTDDSVRFVRANYSTVEIIQLDQNYGFAKGYNEALKQVQSDYYVLLNSDVEVDRGWIRPVIGLLESSPAIAACQPKILQYSDPTLFEYAGAAGGWLDYLGYPFAKGRVFDYCEKDLGQYDQSEPIFWASGAALIIRAEVFQRVGGFDPYFFAHQEEIDLCWRIQRAGYLIYSCPESIVYHVGAGTLPKGNKKKVFLNFRNNLIMMAKNLPPFQRVWKISWRFLLDAVSAFKSLLGGELTYFTAVFKAHFHFIYWLFLPKQRTGLNLPKRVKLNGYYKNSVVWDHFIGGKKKFSEIV